MQFLKTSDFPQEIIILLERAHYEVETRKNIIKIILQDNLNEYYQNYWEDYLLYLKTYDALQKNFQDQYLTNYNYKKCIIDFDSKQIILQ